MTGTKTVTGRCTNGGHGSCDGTIRTGTGWNWWCTCSCHPEPTTEPHRIDMQKALEFWRSHR